MAGFAIGSPYPLTIGRRIRHWAAPEDAIGWFRQAAFWLNDNARIELLKGRSPAEQAAFLELVQGAIISAFNCLNIVWWTDPISRSLYRKYFAGNPNTTGSSMREALFGRRANYGGSTPVVSGSTSDYYGWFVPNSDVPVVRDPGGLIPRAAWQNFLRHNANTHPMMFIPTLGFNLSTLSGVAIPDVSDMVGSLAVELETDVKNNYFLTLGNGAINRCSAGLAYPRQCSYVVPNVVGLYGYDSTVAGRPSDWDTNWFQIAASSGLAPNSRLFESYGPFRYIDYLREWMAGMTSRTGAQIIQDSRAYVAFANNESVVAMGGRTQFITEALGAAGDVVAQQAALDPGLDAAAQAAFALGGALAGVTYGISAVVGGLVGGGLMLANRGIRKDVSNRGKDDLGRWKPVFERAWLSGDPNSTGQPDPPAFQVEFAPPEFTPLPPRGTIVAPGNSRIQTASSSDFPIGKIALGAGVAFVGWQAIKRMSK